MFETLTISEGTTELKIKVMDEDLLTADDELGVASIPLHTVFELWKTAVTSYNVLKTSGKYQGEIRVSLTFEPEAPAYHAS
ncbi:Elicitor-responsive protein 3 [Melia azedarach]|uniref:Elicitor-responsive protein 3 n=1 Tax=Melia azedarach TaxID=155640 RepID=A0ACC1XRQ4_MELAZ|nr:Elicitor-responsive protein 3 [Melia azedarach]